MGRRPKSRTAERKALERLVRAHRGDIAAVAKARGTSRQATSELLHKHHPKLAGLAAQLRSGLLDARGNPQPEDAQRAQLLAAMRKAGNRPAAAKALGIGRMTLHRLCERLGIPPGPVSEIAE